MRMRTSVVRVLGVLLLVIWTGTTWATTTGLNNIPTADVVPRGWLVWQQINNIGGDQPWRHTAGFKYGLSHNLEVGLDGLLKHSHQDASGAGVTGAGGAPAYPFTFQAKYRIESRTSGLAFALGVANLSTNTAKAGKPVFYGAAARDFKPFRGHLGYLLQSGGSGAPNNNTFFAGVDKAVNRRLTLRADWLQINHRSDSLSSLGFIYKVSDQFLIEGWYSLPTTNGVHNTFTLKFDFPVKLLQ